jgi:transposase
MVSRRSFSREFKLSICESVELGQMSKAQVLRQHGLSPGVLDRWLDQYRVRGSDAFPSSGSGPLEVTEAQRTKELEALIGRQALEIEFLKAALKKGAELREKKQP